MFNRILEFSRGRPLWQQDIIRRLYTQSEFTSEDIQDALKLLKSKYGLVEEDSPVPSSKPLSNEHVPQHREIGPPTVINSIGDVRNVNRLAEEQTIPFATEGLTVIYGDNGSGKSGYCRILKKVCRVRAGGDEKIHGDVFTSAGSEPAEAKVRYSIGKGEVEPYQWRDEDLTLPDSLARMAVFDATTVPLYAEKDGKIDFYPQGLDILRDLGQICGELSRELSNEMVLIENSLKEQLPNFTEGTEIAGMLGKLVASTPRVQLPTAEEISERARWSSDLQNALDDLENKLRHDPNALARQCRLLVGAIDDIIRNVVAAKKILSNAAVKRYYGEALAAKTARKAADLDAEDLFKSEPLGGIGSEPWRLMFQYARAYSEVAYPGEMFPVTGSGKRCLLCQQSLENEASQRLKRFDDFVKRKAEVEAERRERDVRAAKEQTNSLTVRTGVEADLLLRNLEEVDPGSEALISVVKGYLDTLTKRRSYVIKAFDGKEKFDSIPPLSESPIRGLSRIKRRLTARAKEYEREKNDVEKRKALERRRDELKARKKLSEELSVILRRRNALEKYHLLKECRDACDTRGISRRATDLRREVVTEAFTEKLRREVEGLDLTHLPLKIRDRTDEGEGLIGVGLNCKVKISNKEILSEGEFRALALACFLTEVNSIDGHDGIIVDDPVSSLDYCRVERVARRLVGEAKKRQVIVFTHDLTFLYDLREHAAKENVPYLQHYMYYDPERGFGTVKENDEPWISKKVKHRLPDLTIKLSQVRNIRDTNSNKYRVAVRSFYNELSDTWERCIEEILLNGVVQRFGKDVRTQSLKSVSVEDGDYKKIYWAMKDASNYRHDMPIGRNLPLPDYEVMKAALDKLNDFTDQLKRRGNKLAEHRKAVCEKPPMAESK